MSLNDAMTAQRDMEMTDHPNAAPRRVAEGTYPSRPTASNSEALDALENLYKMMDTPIVRRKLGNNDMMREAMEEAEKVLKGVGRV
tara:strand:+ start:168 stop:425 length:258 start_codon:yes stop_codon:yes gene_type:complete